MAKPDRFVIRRTAEGGLSMGYSAWALYADCPEHMRLAYLAGGQGLEERAQVVGESLLYGKLWHAGIRARMAGLDEHGVFEAVVTETSDDLSNDIEGTCLAVHADLDWFEANSHGLMQARVLLAEQTLVARVGKHEMRGTPDLVLALPASWGGQTALIDWKTVDPWRGLTDARAHDRARMSAQVTFYLALLRAARPEAATCDAQHVLIPRQVTNALAKIASPSFKGKTKAADIAIKAIGIHRTPEQLDEMLMRFEQTADELLAREGMSIWARNDAACVKPWGVCKYAKICHVTPALRAAVIDELYTRRI